MALGKKTGGRSAGTPNKPKPIKEALRAHSSAFFDPSIVVDQQLIDMFAEMERPCPFALGQEIAQLDLNLALMEPAQRVDAEIKLLQYHTPKMQSVAADVSVDSPAAASLEAYLRDLAKS